MADQVTDLTALTWSALVIAMVWVFLCIAGVAGIVIFARMKIMYSCGYGWKDAGVLLRRRSKKALHAKLNAERPEPVRAQVVPRLPEVREPITASLVERYTDGPGYTEAIDVISSPATTTHGLGAAGQLPETVTFGQVD